MNMLAVRSRLARTSLRQSPLAIDRAWIGAVGVDGEVAFNAGTETRAKADGEFGVIGRRERGGLAIFVRSDDHVPGPALQRLGITSPEQGNEGPGAQTELEFGVDVGAARLDAFEKRIAVMPGVGEAHPAT